MIVPLCVQVQHPGDCPTVCSGAASHCVFRCNILVTVSLCVQVQHPGDCDGGDGLRQDAAGQVSLCSADSQTERHQHHGACQGEDDIIS